MSEPTESTYVWRRINRAKLPLILDDDGDWVANPNIEAAGKLLQRKVNSMRQAQGHDPTPKHFAHWLNDLVVAALTPGDTKYGECDVTDCDRPATECVVGEAGDLWLCRKHAARLVANPNISAAMGRFYKLWNGDNDLTLEEIWAEAVAAALTPGATDE